VWGLTLVPTPTKAVNGRGKGNMVNQEMGPDRIKVRVTVTADAVIDKDDLARMRIQGWEDTLRYLHQEGIPIRQTIATIKEGGGK